MMYGLVEVHKDFIINAYNYVSSYECKSDGFFVKAPPTDKKISMMKPIIKDLAYATTVASSNHLLVKIEIVNAILDILTYFDTKYNFTPEQSPSELVTNNMERV